MGPTPSSATDELFQSLTAADCGLIRMDADPLLVMLKRLEAASKLVSDTDEESDQDPYVPYAIYWLNLKLKIFALTFPSQQTHTHQQSPILPRQVQHKHKDDNKIALFNRNYYYHKWPFRLLITRTLCTGLTKRTAISYFDKTRTLK